MPAPGGILAVDLSTLTGWCYGSASGNAPEWGVWRLPGMKNLGRCWVELQNKLEDFMSVTRPALLVFATPLAANQTTARLLLGLAAHAESSAYRLKVQTAEVTESTARKEVLGRGSFTVRDADGVPIRGEGSKVAKAMALDWCQRQGWDVADHNAADACVVWEYARRVLARQRGIQ